MPSAYSSSFTGLRKTPMPSTSASMMSPGLTGSVAPRSAVAIMSPGLKVCHLDTSATM